MKKTLTQTQALYLLQQLKKQQEPEGGMLFFDAVNKIRLDHTPESIVRLDSFFQQLRQKGITLDKIFSQSNHKNFLLTLGVYISSYLGHLLDEVPHWYGYKEFVTKDGNEAMPAEFPFSLVAQFAYGICLPFGAMMEAFTSDFSIETYIENTKETILSKSLIDPRQPASDISTQYLKKVRTGKLIDNTIAYPELLAKVNFDYSMKSLQKIDQILEYIKKTERLSNKRSFFGKSSYEKFITDPNRQFFIYLLGCYIGMTAAQLANATPKWYNHEQISEMTNDPDFGFCIENNQVLIFEGGYMMLPLMAVTNFLFDLNPNSSVGAVDFANNVARQCSSHLTSYPLANNTNVKLPKDWETAASLAGNLAGWNLATVIDGQVTAPMSIKHGAESDKFTIVNYYDGDIDSLLQQIDIPMPDAPYDFLSYDIHANLPTGRTDAITLEVRVHSEPKLSVRLLLPYRHSEHPFGFAIYPVVTNQPVDSVRMPAFIQAFYQSALNFKDMYTNEDYWTNYYIEKHDLFEMPAWTKRDIAGFDPDESEIEIFTYY